MYLYLYLYSNASLRGKRLRQRCVATCTKHFLIRMRGARPCVATDAATIEGTISVRCNRRRYD